MLDVGGLLSAFAIPLHRPSLNQSDADAVVAAIRTGLLTGDGPASAALARAACHTLSCGYAFPTPSGTHALELLCRALPLEPGDEVICPSFTFVSAPNAVVLAGGIPVFADVDPFTMNLDADDVAARITPRTRAIIVSHYGGIASQLDRLESLATARKVDLLEDAAHGLGGSFDGRPLGTWGKAAAFSFHGTKNLVSGEGGMLVTSEPAFAARTEVIREKGTDRSRFLRGDVDRYTWQEVGSSYLMSDILAALVASQWSRLAAITAGRCERFEGYSAAFEPLAARGVLVRPTIPSGCSPAYHIYHLMVGDAVTRDALVGHLRQRGIEASSHFVPLHLSPFARKTLRTKPGMLPVSERVAERLLRLPLYPDLPASDQQTVIDAVFGFFGQRT